MNISLICAASQNNVIGQDNKMPWYLPADFAHFRRTTLGHYVLMGRKTYQSIGMPLRDRVNIVITRQRDFYAEGCQIAHSLEAALDLCPHHDEVFVIGGALVYRQALPCAKKIYLTRVHHDFEGDTFMFKIDPSAWREISREDFEPDKKNNYAYSFITYQRSRQECED